MTKVATRFAPSPTGHLHIGGARTAIFCWLLSRHFGGSFYLRIEDTDRERSRQEYTDSILASIKWLGLDLDREPVYQSERTELYNAAVDQLLAEGKAYWCSCSPEKVEAMREAARQNGQKPRYDGTCREKNVGPGPGHCVRLKAPLSGSVVFDDLVKGHMVFDVAELDDMIIRRADGMPTYNMAVVVDDSDMEITHVVRGDDHLSNTPRQILIYQALGKPLPVFGHVPMILGSDRQKLSKRHGAKAVIEYQNDGLLPQALVNYLARLGWSHGDQEIFSLEELVKHFDGKNLNSAAAAFDPAKLSWLNAHYMRGTPVPELAGLVAPFAEGLGLTGLAPQALEKIIPLYLERNSSLDELAASMRPLLVSADRLEALPSEGKGSISADGKKHLTALRERLEAAPMFDAAALGTLLHDFADTSGLKFKEFGPPLRLALTRVGGGPGLPEIMEALGKDESLKRVDVVLS